MSQRKSDKINTDNIFSDNREVSRHVTFSGRIHLHREILFAFYYESLAAHMSHLIFHIIVFVSKGYQRLKHMIKQLPCYQSMLPILLPRKNYLWYHPLFL